MINRITIEAMIRLVVLAGHCFLYACCSCAAQAGTVLRLHHFVDERPLVPDTVTYRNSLQQSYTISRFKYYIGKVTLRSVEGRAAIQDGYFLIDAGEPESCRIVLKDIPDGQYSSLSFIVGVDSADNCSGAQSGALDPVNGMFWAWNTGYIFLKLEGRTPSSTAPGHLFEYHIGGYLPPWNNIMQVLLPFDKPVQVTGGKSILPDIAVNAAVLLQPDQPVDFARMPAIADAVTARIMSPAILHMFRLLPVKKKP